eukprot:TRINITY_DN102725_c0_g1_i1.p1 TRINITY_DN102725_c0_g1~~TRINITY_DN102725_c0_g1_i1.p1  ORF type:complete len:515 (+),score=85.23 TRINITY_DN102725_c0_g1_i1:99-1643(+)
MARASTHVLLLGVLGLESGCVEGAPSLSLFQSAKDTGDRLAKLEDVPLGPDGFEMPVVVDISSTETDQEITGFGGAFTEASAVVFQSMSEENQAEFIEKYFDPDSGIGYTVGRVHINSCDFSPSPSQWSEDDVAGDFDLVHFDTNLTHDSQAMIPLIRKGMAKIEAAGRKLKLFASPWSPPAWMKTNGQMDNNGKEGKLKDDSKAAWAKYFAKWIQAYKDHGVPLWAVTPQNEPENAASWEACQYSDQEEADWIGDYLGPTLREAHPEVLIFPFDHNKDDVDKWADTMFNHEKASQYVSGIAFHWYTGDYFDKVGKIHAQWPNMTLLPTEATWEKYRWSPGVTPETGDWKMGEGYGHDIMGDLNNGAVGWTDWNLLLDTTGGPNHVGNNCDAPMFADAEKKALYLHPQYYYIGHFSKYLVPGSKRLKSSVSGSRSYSGKSRGYGVCTEEDGLQATAFQRPDNVIAIVVQNCADSPVDFKIKDIGRAAKATIPAHAIQTYLLTRGEENSEETIVV